MLTVVLDDKALYDFEKAKNFFYFFYWLNQLGGKIFFVGDRIIHDEKIKNMLERNGINIVYVDENFLNYKESFFIGLKKDERFLDDRAYIFDEKSDYYDFNLALDYIKKRYRSAELVRKTKETKIYCKVELEGEGKSSVKTGIGFFDHMLEQIARHSNINLDLICDGDLFVDEHHTVEDCGIALGECILKSLGNKIGIKRYGFGVPMDESYAYCAIDLSGRNLLVFKAKFKREKIGDFPTELTEEFFRGVALGLKANIRIKSKGKNEHHKIEAIFKSFAKALNEACRLDERNKGYLPSTKEVL